MGKFSLSACSAPSRAAKRSAADDSAPSASHASPGKGKTVPRAADLVVVEQGPKPQRQASRMPSSAPVFVTVHNA